MLLLVFCVSRLCLAVGDLRSRPQNTGQGRLMASPQSSRENLSSSQSSDGGTSELLHLLARPGSASEEPPAGPCEPVGQPGAHVTPVPWRARGHMAGRRWARKRSNFRSLKKWSGGPQAKGTKPLGRTGGGSWRRGGGGRAGSGQGGPQPGGAQASSRGGQGRCARRGGI